jgi:hypothetical protein
MMFLSFGIMGVIALFFIGVNNGNVSMKHTKATLIAQEVREALLNAMKFPREVVDANGNIAKLYRFELPSTIDIVDANTEWTGEDNEIPKQINGFYFQIDDVTTELKNAEQVLFDFRNQGEEMDKRVLDLPFEAMNADSNSTLVKAQTWRYRTYTNFEKDSDYDEDDSHFYSFRIILRRSISYPTAGKLQPGDRLVATVYVFRQYNQMLIPDGNFEKYDITFGYPTFEDELGNYLKECAPILKYEFFISAQ